MEQMRYALENLVSDLIHVKTDYKSNNKNIAAKHTEVFIEAVNRLIDRINIEFQE